MQFDAETRAEMCHAWCQTLYWLFGRVPALRPYFITIRASHTSYRDALNDSLDMVSKGESLDVDTLFERLDFRTDIRDRCKSHFVQKMPSY